MLLYTFIILDNTSDTDQIATHIFNVQAQRPSVIVRAPSNNILDSIADEDINDIKALNENIANDCAISEIWSDEPAAGDLDIYQNTSDIDDSEAYFDAVNNVTVQYATEDNIILDQIIRENENNFIDSEEQFVIVEFDDYSQVQADYDEKNVVGNSEDQDENMVN